ncbi:MAG TPA: beta-ketoacyl-ACP synthase 3 [Nitrospiraceae bacterium]|nr:beta-ketoacyl-ACP synthase 3 [Nitrospiraceae bacterium]
MIRSRIIGTGSYLAGRLVENREIAGPLSLTSEQAYRLTGIRSRYWVDEGTAASDLAVEACRRACAASGVSPSQVEAILLSTTSPDTVFPSTACYVQRALGGTSAMAFDLAASCSGFLYGLSMADAMLRSRQVRTCLVAAAEVKSRFLDPTDRETALVFGDGAGAALLVAEDGGGEKAAGIVAVRTYADGAGHDLITVPAGGSRQPIGAETIRANRHVLRMKGGAVFRLAVRRLERALGDLLKERGMTIDNVDHVVVHQANARILDAIRRRLAIPMERMHSVIERYGNTSSASLPIALDSAVRERPVRPGDMLLLGAFGGGLTWATGLVRW